MSKRFAGPFPHENWVLSPEKLQIFRFEIKENKSLKNIYKNN